MRKPNCCHIEEEPLVPSCHNEDGRAHQKKRFDVLLWGSLIGVTLLFVLAAFFPGAIVGYPW